MHIVWSNSLLIFSFVLQRYPPLLLKFLAGELSDVFIPVFVFLQSVISDVVLTQFFQLGYEVEGQILH